jgi:hypothetical protein
MKQQNGGAYESNLVIVARNEQPSRDESYPRTWLIYRYDQSTLEVDLSTTMMVSPSWLGILPREWSFTI